MQRACLMLTCRNCHAKNSDGSFQCRSCGATMATGESSRAFAASPFDAVPRSRRAAALQPQHESSQMFTLAALVGRTESPAPASEAPQRRVEAKKEGSGVIDLNALARAAAERARKAPSEPPPGAFAREARVIDEPPPTLGRRLRFAGIVAAAAMLAVVGVVVAASGGDEPKPQVKAAAAAPTQHVEQGAPPQTPEPPAAVSPLASPKSSDDDKTTAKAPKAGKGHKGGGHARATASGPKLSKVTSSGTKDAAAAKPPPPPKPTAASDPCGCKGNLQCAIKCFK